MPRADTPPRADPRKDPVAPRTIGPEPTPSGATPVDVDQLLESERYEVQALIGSGGMGKVYKAFDRQLMRAVALKFLRGGDAAVERKFLREAQAQARVDHAHVCRVYEVGRLADRPYIAMQYVSGKTLRDAVGELSFEEKLALMRDVAEAVHAAHQTGLVHRDIKPQNILVERGADGPRPFVTDFGLARDLQSPGETADGTVLGTPQYMAPEQANGDLRSLDARTDVYGLGATLYEVLTARPPFEGGSQLQILFRMIHEDPKPPRKLAAGMPADAESVVLKCLEKEPARRYQTAKALAEDLQRVLDGEPVRARSASAADRLWRKLRRNKALAAALLALVLALGVPRLWTLLDRGAPLTVAVADFDNQTDDSGLDGLSGMLITSLEQSRRLSVLTRSRMFDLLHQIGHAQEQRIGETVGRELARKANAQALLLGSIRQFNDLYVIDLKILEPRTNRYLAAIEEQGEGKAALPSLIDKVSRAARRVLRDKAGERGAPVEDVTTRSLEAYQHYFRGDEAVDHLQFARAAEHFRAALSIDGDFALAWYRLAYAHMWEHDGPRARDAIERALQLADKLPEKERVLALDPTMERALQHLVWSYQLLGERNAVLAAAQDYVRRVNGDEAWGHLGRAQAALGELDRARQTFEQAAQLFPHSALPAVDLAALDAWQFEVDAAAARLSPLLDPGWPARERELAHLTLGGALVHGGRARAAVAAFESAAAAAREARDPEAEAIALSAEALVHFLYLRDPDGARRIARDATARGLPEAHPRRLRRRGPRPQRAGRQVAVPRLPPVPHRRLLDAGEGGRKGHRGFASRAVELHRCDRAGSRLRGHVPRALRRAARGPLRAHRQPPPGGGSNAAVSRGLVESRPGLVGDQGSAGAPRAPAGPG